MYRRKDRNGNPTGPWWIRVGGQRVSSGTVDKERARRKEQKENAALWDEREGFATRTWDRAILTWKDNNPALSKRDNIQHFIVWWTNLLGETRRLDTITPALVHSLVIEHRKGVTLETRTKPNSTANNYVAFLQRVIEESSMLRPKLQYYPRMLGNTRWTPVAEWLDIATHLTPDEHDICTWALASGLREEKCMHYEWSWDHETWGMVPVTKNGEPLGIPYNRTMQAIMARRRAAAVRHVRYAFTDGNTEWTTDKVLNALHRATRAAGKEYITFHGLRHTFNTWLARAHVPQDIRKRLCGHASKESNDVYTHYDVEYLRPYSEIIDRLLAGEVISILSRPNEGAANALTDQGKKSA